jgi:hypothetical protein
MTSSDIKADWLQDTLQDVAERLRGNSEDLARCAGQLERIVGDLRSPDEAVCPRQPPIMQGQGEPVTVTITIGQRRLS